MSDFGSDDSCVIPGTPPSPQERAFHNYKSPVTFRRGQKSPDKVQERDPQNDTLKRARSNASIASLEDGSGHEKTRKMSEPEGVSITKITRNPLYKSDVKGVKVEETLLPNANATTLVVEDKSRQKSSENRQEQEARNSTGRPEIITSEHLERVFTFRQDNPNPIISVANDDKTRQPSCEGKRESSSSKSLIIPSEKHSFREERARRLSDAGPKTAASSGYKESKKITGAEALRLNEEENRKVMAAKNSLTPKSSISAEEDKKTPPTVARKPYRQLKLKKPATETASKPAPEEPKRLSSTTDDDEVLSGTIVSQLGASINNRILMKKQKTNQRFKMVQGHKRLREVRQCHVKERSEVTDKHIQAMDKINQELDAIQGRLEKNSPMMSKMLESILKGVKTMEQPIMDLKNEIASTVDDMGNQLESLDRDLTQCNAKLATDLEASLEELRKTLKDEDMKSAQESTEIIRDVVNKVYTFLE